MLTLTDIEAFREMNQVSAKVYPYRDILKKNETFYSSKKNETFYSSKKKHTDMLASAENLYHDKVLFLHHLNKHLHRVHLILLARTTSFLQELAFKLSVH